MHVHGLSHQMRAGLVQLQWPSLHDRKGLLLFVNYSYTILFSYDFTDSHQ